MDNDDFLQIISNLVHRLLDIFVPISQSLAMEKHYLVLTSYILVELSWLFSY